MRKSSSPSSPPVAGAATATAPAPASLPVQLSPFDVSADTRESQASSSIAPSSPSSVRTRLCTHLCLGNYKARAVGPRRIAQMFPAFLDSHADEMRVEMASREFAEIEIIAETARRMDAAVGIIDVTSHYVEIPTDLADRVRLCLRHAPSSYPLVVRNEAKHGWLSQREAHTCADHSETNVTCSDAITSGARHILEECKHRLRGRRVFLSRRTGEPKT